MLRPLFSDLFAPLFYSLLSAPVQGGGGGAPAKPFAKGARVAYIGDSILQNGNIGTAASGIIRNALKGEMNFLHAMSPNINIDVWADPTMSYQSRYFQGANQGGAGDNTAQALARIATIQKLKPDIALVAIGTNGYVRSDVQAIIDGIKSVGVQYIGLCLVRPEDSTVSTAGNVGYNNDIISAFTGQAGVTIIDLFTPYYDSVALRSKVGYLNDGLHPNQLGAYYGALAIKAYIDTLVSPGNLLLDLWNGGGNIIPNGIFAGTAGTLSGSGVAGTVPDLWTFLRGSVGYLSTAAISLEANAETGGQSVVVDVTPSGSATDEHFRLRTLPTTVLTQALRNKWYRPLMEIELDTWPFWGAPELQMIESPGSSNVEGTGAITGTSTVPAVGHHLWISSPPVLFDNTMTGFTTQINPDFMPTGATGVGRYKIKRVGMFEVPNPMTVWNFP